MLIKVCHNLAELNFDIKIKNLTTDFLDKEISYRY